jgi:branched-chain amino acid transport system ATP-binding protein
LPLLPPTKGSVHFDGEDITRRPAHLLPKKGLAMVPEGGRLFPFMTVEENLQLGGFAHRAGMSQRLRRGHGAVFPCCASAAGNWQAICREASGRCAPSPAP